MKWKLRLVLAFAFALPLMVPPPVPAATRTVFPGGLYTDALPSGEHVVLYPGSRFETHVSRRLALPPGESYGLMFVYLSPQAGEKFVGLGHDTGHLWVFHNGHGWEPIDGPTSGRVVIDTAGGIRDFIPAGYAYVDEVTGEPVSRIDTYGPFNGLSEWVKTADLYIGQGHQQGGVRVWDGGSRLRVLEDGEIYFIRVHRAGERVAISYVKSGEGAIVVQTTLAELRGLPFEITEPPPPPPPPPSEVDCGTIPPLGQQRLQQLAAKYADEIRSPDDDVRRAWAMKAAQQLAFSVSPEYGTKRADPGRPLSKDSVSRVIRGRLCNWDLVNGATRELTFGRGEDITGQVYVAVTPKDWLNGGGPTPDPRIAELEQQLAAALASIAQLRAINRDVTAARDAADRRIGELEAERDDLKVQLAQVRQERDDLLKRPEPRCEAKLPGWAKALGLRVGCTVIK